MGWLFRRQRVRGGGIWFSGMSSGRPSDVSPVPARCPYVCCPITSFACREIPMTQIFIMWVDVAENVFKVRGQTSRSNAHLFTNIAILTTAAMRLDRQRYSYVLNLVLFWIFRFKCKLTYESFYSAQVRSACTIADVHVGYVRHRILTCISACRLTVIVTRQ